MLASRMVATALLLLTVFLVSGAGESPVLDPAPAGFRDNPAAVRQGWVTPRSDRIHGSWLASARRNRPERTVKVWAFLTDKGVTDPVVMDRRLREVGAGWNAATRDRRAATGRPPVFTDLPVHDAYVDALESAGFAVVHRSRWLNAVSLRVAPRDLAALERFPFVRFVQPVLVKLASSLPPEPAPAVVPDDIALPGVTPGAGAIDPVLEATWYGGAYAQLTQIKVLDLHRLGYTGAGVTVMMLDTGFKKSHPAFQVCTNILAEHDFVRNDGNTENEAGDSANQHLHGTGTWGTAGGFAPGNLVGPAFAAAFVLAKTEDIDQEVRAEEDNYVAALEWGDTLGVDVASASLAYLTFDDSTGYAPGDLDGDTAVITVAVDIAVGKGMCCVNSAANEGPGPSSIWTPADADSIISVGAVDAAGAIAGFSSRGPTADGRIKPEVVARGVGTWWAQSWSDGYGPANGTSLSCPLTGGLAALLKEAHPGWSGYDIRVALMQTADNAGTPNNDVGWGLVDGLAALTYNAAVPTPPRMTLPFALCDPPDSSVVGTATPKLVWGESATAIPGDTVDYTLFFSINGGAQQSAAAGADTCLVLPVALSAGDTLSWWAEAVGDSGYARKSLDTRVLAVSTALDVPAVGPERPAVALGAAFPNPMRLSTRIAFRAPAGEAVDIRIVAVTGRVVRRLGALGTGAETAVAWDGRDQMGRMTPPGVYFYTLGGGRQTRANKLVRLP